MTKEQTYMRMENMDKMKGSSYPGTPTRNSPDLFSFLLLTSLRRMDPRFHELKKKTHLRLQIAQNAKSLLSLLLRSSFLNTKHIVSQKSHGLPRSWKSCTWHHGAVWISPTLLSTVVDIVCLLQSS